mgnify:CR=1 FL=1
MHRVGLAAVLILLVCHVNGRPSYRLLEQNDGGGGRSDASTKEGAEDEHTHLRAHGTGGGNGHGTGGGNGHGLKVGNGHGSGTGDGTGSGLGDGCGDLDPNTKDPDDGSHSLFGAPERCVAACRVATVNGTATGELCSDHGDCRHNTTTRTTFCKCAIGYSGDHCETSVTATGDVSAFHWLAVGGVVVLVLGGAWLCRWRRTAGKAYTVIENDGTAVLRQGDGVWETALTPEGKTYWIHSTTNKVCWNDPCE